MSQCDECGFVYEDVARDVIASELRGLAPKYAARLTVGVGALRAHAKPDVWSPLEYACHVRDVLRVQRERILVAQIHETPEFPSMRREERVAEERYNEQLPSVVAEEIRIAGEDLAMTCDALTEDGWNRTGFYHWPTTKVRTVEWIGRHTIHEGRHHLGDIDRLLDAGG